MILKKGDVHMKELTKIASVNVESNKDQDYI